MSKKLVVLVAAVGLVGAAPAVAPAAKSASTPVAVVAKTCSGGFTHAVIGGQQKCLRAGEFCAHRYDRQYRRYDYRCIRYYRNVNRYRLTYA